MGAQVHVHTVDPRCHHQRKPFCVRPHIATSTACYNNYYHLPWLGPLIVLLIAATQCHCDSHSGVLQQGRSSNRWILHVVLRGSFPLVRCLIAARVFVAGVHGGHGAQTAVHTIPPQLSWWVCLAMSVGDLPQHHSPRISAAPPLLEGAAKRIWFVWVRI